MAEAALFSLAGKLVNTIASPAFKKAHERACFFWKANDAFEELKRTIETAEAKLRDAERMQGSEAMKNFIERIADVLYKAEDLFDEVATNDLLKQHREGNQYVNKVQDFFSGRNPVVSNCSIASQVEDITKMLQKVYSDMGDGLTVAVALSKTSQPSNNNTRVREDTGSNVNPKAIIGRTDDKKAILDFILDPDPNSDESSLQQKASLIAIVGIGGMGKSTLAQLVYHDDAVLNEFDESRRWWVYISNIFDESVVLRKICNSLKVDLTTDVGGMQSNIKGCIRNGHKFLLVLDDVWDDNRLRLDKWLSLLCSETAQGSKILITTRSSLVARAANANKVYNLKGLSSAASWELFMNSVRSRNSPEIDVDYHSDLARKIMEKCANVPLAIRAIGSALCTSDPDNWNSVIDRAFPRTTTTPDEESTMTAALKFSYDCLPLHLKPCFAYCCLFQKGSVLDRKKVIYLWVAQGFVKPTESATLEENGQAYFMDLYGRCFFENPIRDATTGGIAGFKMHDLFHELAVSVGGKASVALMEVPAEYDARKIRHVRVGREIDDSWNIPPLLLEAGCTRSLLFTRQSCIGPQVLGQQVKKQRLLRALELEGLNIKSVPSAIGKLKYLRYLNLSDNVELQALPDSITKSVNLLSLDVSGCSGLLSLPKDFRRLVSLVHLDISRCTSLMHMPVGFGGLTSLQHLSDFKVSRGSGSDDRGRLASKCSTLMPRGFGGDNGMQNGLAALKDLNLHGQLRISYDNNPRGGWSDNEVMIEPGQIPKKIRVLSIWGYPGTRIPSLNLLIELKSLKLAGCRKVMHFPSLRCLPCLRELMLDDFAELEYMEGDEGSASTEAFFFPKLQLLELTDFPKLERWSQGQQADGAYLSFPKLSRVTIQQCPRLKSIPSSPALKQVSLTSVGPEIVQQLVSSSAADLKDVKVTACRGLTSLPVQALASLLKLDVRGCPSLEELRLQSGVLEDLTILRCPKLKLWDQGEDTVGVDWGSLRSLRVLFLDKSPEPGKIPDCLADLKARGQLRIKGEK